MATDPLKDPFKAVDRDPLKDPFKEDTANLVLTLQADIATKDSRIKALEAEIAKADEVSQYWKEQAELQKQVALDGRSYIKTQLSMLQGGLEYARKQLRSDQRTPFDPIVDFVIDLSDKT